MNSTVSSSVPLYVTVKSKNDIRIQCPSPDTIGTLVERANEHLPSNKLRYCVQHAVYYYRILDGSVGHARATNFIRQRNTRFHQ